MHTESCTGGLQAGVNASSEQVLEWLVRADTASAFNISLRDVNITGVSQVTTPVSLMSAALRFVKSQHTVFPQGQHQQAHPMTITTQATRQRHSIWVVLRSKSALALIGVTLRNCLIEMYVVSAS